MSSIIGLFPPRHLIPFHSLRHPAVNLHSRGGEQRWLLADQSDVAPQAPQVERPQVPPVQRHGPCHGVVEALDESHHGGLAAARGANNGHRFAGGDGQGEALGGEGGTRGGECV